MSLKEQLLAEINQIKHQIDAIDQVLKSYLDDHVKYNHLQSRKKHLLGRLKLRKRAYYKL